MNENSNTQTDKKKLSGARIAGRIAVAVVFVALLAALLIGATSAQFRETKTFLTDFDIASFNTVILGAEESDTPSTALTKLENGNIEVFAEKFDSDNLLPGTTDKKLPFTVTNGKNSVGYSGADVQYCIKLRTTKTLPLTFKLTHITTNAGGSQVTTYYYPSTTAKEIVSSVTGDAKMYEYSFYSKEDNTSSDAEAVFNLGSGSAALNLHSLNISWPSSDNSVDYMKEVEMLEVYVETSSVNKTPTSGRTTEVSPTPVPSESDYTPVGLLYIIETTDGYKYSITLNQKDTVYSYSYDIDYRAFKKSASNAPYEFSMVIDDGISYQKSPTVEEQALYPSYSHYTIRMRVPVAAVNYSVVTESSAYSNAGYNYRITLNYKPAITLVPIEGKSTYYIYRMNEGYPDVFENGEKLTGVTTDKEALEYWENLSNSERAESYIYRQDLYREYGYTYERVITNTIKPIDTLTHEVNSITGHSDEITISIYAADGSNADISKIIDGADQESFSVDHKIYLDVDVVYSDSSETELLPKAETINP